MHRFTENLSVAIEKSRLYDKIDTITKWSDYMKSSGIAFPLVHKRSYLPILAVVFGIIGAIPAFMVFWVAVCSKFTRVEGGNGTDLYNVYVCVRALFVITGVGCLVAYCLRRASVALLPATIPGLASGVLKLIITIKEYTGKKAVAEALNMHPSYTQNYVSIAEAALFALTALLFLLYLLGIINSGFPAVMTSVLGAILSLYCVISYTSTFAVNQFNTFSKCYAAPICIAVLFICASSKSKAQIQGKTKYKPRRMKK